MRVNTELCIDLKTRLQTDLRMKPGKLYRGILKRDVPGGGSWLDEGHFTFVEALPYMPVKRNPHVFVGEYITITRRDDGSLRLNFKPVEMRLLARPAKFALSVARELIQGLKGLIGKKPAT